MNKFILVIIILVAAGLGYFYLNNNQQSKSTQTQSSTLVEIEKDQIYLSISKDFRPDINLLGSKVQINLNLINDDLQKQINTKEGQNFLGGLVTGYMAIMISEHVNKYDSIEITLFDERGNQFYRKILTKEDVDSLRNAGYTRENFTSIYKP